MRYLSIRNRLLESKMVALRKKDLRKPSASKADATTRADKAAHDAEVKRQLKIAERIMERDKNILAALAK